MKKMQWLLMPALALSLANCGKRVTVTNGGGPASPNTKAGIIVGADWSEVTVSSTSVSSVKNRNFVVDQGSGDYIKGDKFSFGNEDLQISNPGSGYDYMGEIIFNSYGSFKMLDIPTSGRVFYLRNMYQSGSKTKLYFEYYDGNYDTEHYDGYLMLVSE